MSVTANPLIGPVPNWNRNSAEMIVVRFESMIVAKRRSEAVLDRGLARAPVAQLLADALEDRARWSRPPCRS